VSVLILEACWKHSLASVPVFSRMSLGFGQNVCKKVRFWGMCKSSVWLT